MTYATLRADIADFLHRDNLTARIPMFVRYATAAFNRELRVTWMESRRVRQLVGEYTQVPSDFLELIGVVRNDGAELKYLARPQFQSAVSMGSNLSPQIYTIEDRQIRVYPAPSADAPVTVAMLYFAAIPDLANNDDTNWLLDRAPDLYLLGALMQARMFMHDDERMRGLVEPTYEKELARMKKDRHVSTGVVSAVGLDIPLQGRFNIYGAGGQAPAGGLNWGANSLTWGA